MTAIEAEVICGAMAHSCRCIRTDCDGTHACNCGGRWRGEWGTGTFEPVNLPEHRVAT